MLCSGCHNFLGNPCTACRTLSRIHFLVERNQLPPAIEGRVVSALRVAAGEICDLVEQHGIFRPSGPPGAVAPDGGVKKAGKEEPAAAESSTGGREEPEKKEDVEGTRKVKEKKKDKKDKKRKAETRVEVTPAATGEEGREEEEDPERVRIAKATPLNRRERKSKDPQAAVDHYASEHPEVFGLGSISIRGSAAKHFKESDERRRERPAQPVKPPPRRAAEERPREREDRDQRQRSRSRKKSKGENHRKRGRDFWRRVKEQEKWHRKQNQRQRQGPGGGSGRR